MRLSTRTQATFAVAAALLLVGAVASAQNLRVMGTTTGEGKAYFNNGAGVMGEISMTSPDSTGIYALRLIRTNENGRLHQWAWWHMNSQYGQDSLQLYEYQDDAARKSCDGNQADGAMCSPRLIVSKGGAVTIPGEFYARGWLRSQGNVGWYSESYGGGWWMTDTTWIRTYGEKGVWTGGGVLGSDRGLTVGYGGAYPPSYGGAIINTTLGIGTPTPDTTYKLFVNGPVAAAGSEIIFTDTAHNHSGRGNPAGLAAIENSRDYGTLMILGRAGTSLGRKVDVWDYLQVNGSMQVSGTIRAPSAVAFYWCPAVSVRCGIDKMCNYCGNFSLSSTCTYTGSSGGSATQACTLVGRLINP